MKVSRVLKNCDPNHVPNHSHAWRGAWNRPMLMDEDSLHPFNVARMTDHNVRGVDKLEEKKATEEWENEGGSPFRFGF